MRGLYRYNAGVNSDTAARLLEVNREFYDRFGESFSITRQRLQPGVKRILATIATDESVLDLGCGNGHFLLELSARGHHASLLGVDYSPPLLQQAGSRSANSPVTFHKMDLTKLPRSSEEFMNIPAEDIDTGGRRRGWDVITMFAVLHHIPSHEIRLEVLKCVRRLLGVDGRFILSNWQFLHSTRLRRRIQPWSRVGLLQESLDQGDYLLDWRGGGEGLRYVHHFSGEELSGLAVQTGMRVSESFTSDGEQGKLGLYQIWNPA